MNNLGGIRKQSRHREMDKEMDREMMLESVSLTRAGKNKDIWGGIYCVRAPGYRD